MVTPNKYRFILGKSPDTSVNLLTNGTFTGGGAGWTVSGATQWAFAGNEATVGGAYCSTGTPWTDPEDFLLTQAGVIIPNNFYYLQYKLKAANCVDTGLTKTRMSWSIGGTYMNYRDDYNETTSTSYVTFTNEYLFAPAGNDFALYGHLGMLGTIDDVLLYSYVWNDPLTYEPIDWDGAKISKRRDEFLNGLIIEYIADLTFIEDGYTYLYDQYTANGFCGEVPVRIEIYNSITNVYELYFEGIIFINDCEFDITKRQVKTKIEDKNASLLFIRSKDVKIDMEQIEDMDSLTTIPLLAPYPVIPIDFNNDAGAYVYSNIDCYEIATLLRTIIIKATNYRLDATSAVFSTGGDFEDYCIGFAAILRSASVPREAYKISINELFGELNKIANLTFSTTTNADGVPTIKVEPKIDYLSSTPVLTLNYVNGVSFTFDKTNIIRTVSIGYDKIDATATGTGLNTPKGIQYYSNNICSQDDLSLVCDYIQNSIVLKRLLDGTITANKYDKDRFIIDTDGTQTVNSGSGTYDYNINIDADDNMARWIETLQFGFLKTNALTTDILTKSTATLDKIYSFKYPLTKAQFDLIAQAYNTIQFNTDGTGATTKNGYLLSADYDIKTGLTDFKLLSN